MPSTDGVADEPQGEWIADWFDESPRGETYGVRRADEVLCYTKSGATGLRDADNIARAINLMEQYQAEVPG